MANTEKRLSNSEKEEQRRRNLEKKMLKCLRLIYDCLVNNHRYNQLPVRFEPDDRNSQRKDLKMTDLVLLNRQFQPGIINGTVPPNHEMINPREISEIIDELMSLIYEEPYEE